MLFRSGDRQIGAVEEPAEVGPLVHVPRILKRSRRKIFADATSSEPPSVTVCASSEAGAHRNAQTNTVDATKEYMLHNRSSAEPYAEFDPNRSSRTWTGVLRCCSLKHKLQCGTRSLHFLPVPMCSGDLGVDYRQRNVLRRSRFGAGLLSACLLRKAPSSRPSDRQRADDADQDPSRSGTRRVLRRRSATMPSRSSTVCSSARRAHAGFPFAGSFRSCCPITCAIANATDAFFEECTQALPADLVDALRAHPPGAQKSSDADRGASYKRAEIAIQRQSRRSPLLFARILVAVQSAQHRTSRCT